LTQIRNQVHDDPQANRRQQRDSAVAISRPQQSNIGLTLYLIFTVSWFLHLPARFEPLGLIRFDLLLVAVIAVIALQQKPDETAGRSPVGKWLRILIAYSIIVIPLVEWPGSVVKIGFPNFVKATVFYYFTVSFIRSEMDLRKFVAVFLTCQVIRVLEPLILHVTTGYWGSTASMAGGSEFLERLSGAPSDVVNPNGLAFVICTVLPLLYFLLRGTFVHRVALLGLSAALLYALILTGSRSGMIGLAVVGIGIFIRSKNKVAMALFTVIALGIGLGGMSADMKDRYLSIFGGSAKNQGTADERLEGMSSQLDVVFHRPIFGHGLGTSAEANYHFSKAGPYGGKAMPAHNLYLEVAQELGILGLGIFVAFVTAIARQFIQLQRLTSTSTGDSYTNRFLTAMQVWFAMSIVFSLASYGLSNYDWYLFGGMAVAMARMRAASQIVGTTEPRAGLPRTRQGSRIS
jgi:O-antigen ligase